MRFVLLLLFGCATSADSRCEEASKAAAQCHGMDASTFLEACAVDDSLADAMLAEDCTVAAGKADGLGEVVFVELCQPVMMTAYLVNDSRNPTSSPIPDAAKAKLRPHFGALVDQVAVHWQATLLDDWPVVHVKDAFMDVGAQTFGTHIYLTSPRSAPPLETLAHELVHAQQAQRFGGLPGFYRAYCRAFYQSGFRYRENALEVEAYALKL